MQKTAPAWLEGCLFWPDGSQQTPFKNEVELRLFDIAAFDLSINKEILDWEDIEERDNLSSTTSDKETGYFWFPESEGSDTPLDLLGNDDRKEFWIAAKNCVILTPWANDKVISLKGGGILRIGVAVKQRDGNSGEKIAGYVWCYQRYPGPQTKDWQKIHMAEIEIPDEDPKTKRLVKSFYVLPISTYKEDGSWRPEDFKLFDELALMFNQTKDAEQPIIPNHVLDCSNYPDDASAIYNSVVVDFYKFGAKYGGKENKLRSFAFKQDGSCKQVPFGTGKAYSDRKSRIKSFEYSHDGTDQNKLTFYAPLKPQYTDNTPEFDPDNPLPQFDSSFKPNEIIYDPLEHVSGAYFDRNGNALRKYTLRGIGSFAPGNCFDNSASTFTDEYYEKGFMPGRFKDRRGMPPHYRMHLGLDLHSWITKTGGKGPPVHSMSYGKFSTAEKPKPGKIAKLELVFPDGTSGMIQHFHNHSFSAAIRDGQFVFPGQLLAYAGDTGNAGGDPNGSASDTVTSKHVHTELLVKGVNRNPANIFSANLESEPETNIPTDPSLDGYRIEVHPIIKGVVRQKDSKGKASRVAGVTVEVHDRDHDSKIYSKTKTRFSKKNPKINGTFSLPSPPKPITVVFTKGGKESRIDVDAGLNTNGQRVKQANVDDF